MRNALAISLIFHAAIIVAVMLGLSLYPTEKYPDIAIVEIVEYDDIAAYAAPLLPEPEIAEVVEEPEPTPVAEPEPEPEPEPDPVELAALPPNPEPVPPPPVPAIGKPEPQAVTRDIPNITPRTKPRPPKRFDTGRIAALLDKRQKEKTPSTTPRAQKSRKAVGNLERARRTANIQQALNAQIGRCWSAPVGASYAETLIVKIRIYLMPDGKLVRPPDILDVARMETDSFFRAAAEAARRAIQRCAPLNLPIQDYEEWREVVLNFDPSMML